MSRFRSQDRAELRAFLGEHFGAGSYLADDRWFDWRFVNNPDCPAEGPPTWICRRQDGIVGLQAGLPIPLEIDGKPLRAAWAIDLMVAPTWRLRGVAPALTARLCDEYALVAGLGIAPAARRAFARSGWLDLGRLPRYVRLLRPLRTGEAPTGRRTVSRTTALASLAATPLLALLAGGDAAVLALARLAGARFARIERFDQRVDGVWAAVAPDHPLIARRDLAALAWRFDASPDAGAYQRYYLMRGERVIGYAVLRRRQDSMMVIDHLCPGRWRWALFAHCLAEARRAGVSALRCLATRPGAQAGLTAFGFLPRPGPYFMVLTKASAGLPQDLVGKAANWYLTEADSDLDHTPIP